jgi:hypothetical protein
MASKKLRLTNISALQRYQFERLFNYEGDILAGDIPAAVQEMIAAANLLEASTLDKNGKGRNKRLRKVT